MHYYKFNIGDYASHTGHLDPIEDIAYRRMLDWHYLHESALPDSVEQIARLIRMRTHCESIANVLREFFTLGEFGWSQAKAMQEIDAYNEKSEKAKKSAAARWGSKPVKSNANALRTECERNANHKPLTTNHKTLTKKQETGNKSIVEQSSTCEVFEHWQTVLNHPRSKLDAKRKRVIQAALKTGYSVEDLKAAISGCSKTPHNMGQNERGQKYDDIGLILRDAGQIDRFIGNNENAPTPQAQARPMSRIEQVRANLENPALNVINQNEVLGHE